MLEARGSRGPEHLMREVGGVPLEGVVGVYEFMDDGLRHTLRTTRVRKLTTEAKRVVLGC